MKKAKYPAYPTKNGVENWNKKQNIPITTCEAATTQKTIREATASLWRLLRQKKRSLRLLRHVQFVSRKQCVIEVSKSLYFR